MQLNGIGPGAKERSEHDRSPAGGKIVLVTGANHLKGIGAAAATTFTRQGARILLPYLRLSPQEFGIDQGEADHAVEASQQ